MSRLKSTKLRIWELKDRSREMSQTEVKKENSFLHKRTDDVKTVGQFLTLNIHIIEYHIPHRENGAKEIKKKNTLYQKRNKDVN